MVSTSQFNLDTLDPAIALLLDTQALLKGRDEPARFDAANGAPTPSTDEIDVEALGLQTADALMDRQSQTTRKRREAAAQSAALLNELIGLPEPLLETAADAMAQKGWSRLAPGIRCLELDLESKAEVELYRIEPNCAVPRHTHDGSEFTLVVTGAFTDETGCFLAGDLSHKGPEDTHQPIANPGEVCYALAVREGDIKLTGFLGLVQKVLGR